MCNVSGSFFFGRGFIRWQCMNIMKYTIIAQINTIPQINSIFTLVVAALQFNYIQNNTSKSNTLGAWTRACCRILHYFTVHYQQIKLIAHNSII